MVDVTTTELHALRADPSTTGIEWVGAHLIDALPVYGGHFCLAPWRSDGWFEQPDRYHLGHADSRARERDAYLTGLQVAATGATYHWQRDPQEAVEECITAALRKIEASREAAAR